MGDRLDVRASHDARPSASTACWAARSQSRVRDQSRARGSHQASSARQVRVQRLESWPGRAAGEPLLHERTAGGQRLSEPRGQTRATAESVGIAVGSNGRECTSGVLKKELATAERVPVRDNGVGAIRRRALACGLDELHVGGAFKKPRAHRTGACAGCLALCRDTIGAGVLIFGARSRQARSAHKFGARWTWRRAGSRNRRPSWRASWRQRRRLCCARDGEHGERGNEADHRDCPTYRCSAAKARGSAKRERRLSSAATPS